MSYWQVPRLRRDGRVIGGVAAGLADEIGVEPLVIRIGFVVLAVAGGWGVVLYAGLWVWLVLRERNVDLDEPYVPQPKGANRTRRIIAVGLVVAGLLVLFRTVATGFDDRLAWPLGVLAVGALVAWHGDGTFGSTRWAAARIGAGVVLVGGGIAAMVALNVDLSRTGDALLAVSVVIAGVALVVAPWAFRLINDLSEERRRRIRSEERSRMAAHLHDSVLQTLALIQRNADDSTATYQLARRQERELRNWLFGGSSAANGSRVRTYLDAAAAEVEQLHGTPVEVVVVGDGPIDPGVESLLAATREAMVNAAKHSRADRVDVYAEVRDDSVEAFVRDTGVGFDPGAVPPDRRGLSDSIRARMAAVGGRVEIHTEPGHGTEVELNLPRRQP